MELRHYSKDLISLRKDWPYLNTVDNYKPHGLWVSVFGEYDWLTWCAAENFAKDRFDVEYEVVLTDHHNIKIITNSDELKAFTNQYGTSDSIFDSLGIDWALVVKDYDGLIITPYLWASRLTVRWYYGWDCASGCIWNLEAIESFTVRS